MNIKPLEPYTFSATGHRYEISGSTPFPPLRLAVWASDAAFTVRPRDIAVVIHRVEASRGYEARGDLWSPGYFQLRMQPGESVTLVVSTEAWEAIEALSPVQAEKAEIERRERLLRAVPRAVREDIPDLVLAADQFTVAPVGRVEDQARAMAVGDEVSTIIAGYHWFTDWGRDTMISLEGLCLLTGRHREAGSIMRMFAHHIRDGLIPNLFPEGDSEGLYHTADATLWFFHALDRYVTLSGDRETLRLILPKLVEIVERHLSGTRFGIAVDHRDGLLRAEAEGYQLTWMDAKVNGWVVTPRRGKPVGINALWYNALCLLDSWAAQERFSLGFAPGELAARVRESFNNRFWHKRGSYLLDVVDGEQGDDTRFRPNQLFAISLPHPVLRADRWRPVVDAVRDRLLTPVGLRTLAPDDPDYKAKYYGDLRARDAAYHQGTVWPWLIGPFIDAWLKVFPHRRAEARAMVASVRDQVDKACVGTINEIFDAEAPFTPRGCIAQAWSVAEVIRALMATTPFES